ncbi:subtilisin-like protein [Mollisia scopiformis]|uniref:Subtilisin-like protein n=1 Tax=Mollisia scopiformis TaxID=149040 RepID=A0A194WUA4_MOLSC|nr:subtilisin-like protein [Mollisia scopiformis]KUJ11254.1 subtilisin-like protein [Mollisia scopiformis]
MSLGNMHNVHRPKHSPSPDSHKYTRLFLDKNNHSHKLVSYTIEEDQVAQQRTVTWTTVASGKIMHIIPMVLPGIPFTNHTIQSPEKKNVVTFRAYNFGGLIKHKFIFEEEEDETRTEALHDPEYHFLDDKECEGFQSRVRGRRLLKTFDTEKISLTEIHRMRPNTAREYARKKPVKLWRRTDTAITFFANLDPVEYQTHLQFYLSWFKQEAGLRNDRKLVLRFNHQSDVQRQHESPSSEKKRRRSNVFIPSKGKRQKSEEPIPRRTSTGGSSSQFLKIHSGELKTDECVKKNNWESLEIQFTNEDDVEKFVSTCLESQGQPGLALSEGPYCVLPFTEPLQPAPVHPHYSPPSSSIENWWQKFNDNRNEIFPIITDNYAPIRIAILDTGIDTGNPYIRRNWDSKWLYRDFLVDDNVAAGLRVDSSGYSSHYVREVIGSLESGRQDQAIDLAGHGTHLAGIVLQLAPNANLCIARVLKNNLTTYDTGEAAKRVALAILYAVQVWKVKVINLSIGFDQEKLGDSEMHVIIHALQYARQQHVVVFAAASNSANRELLAFPACQPDYVLSINSTNGSGGRSWFNPLQQKYHENLSVLGESIKSTWLQDAYGKEEGVFRLGESVWKRAEGTSQATTIAACVAVLIVQFGRQYGVGEKLETFAGVRSVLREMTAQTGDGFWDIVPWIKVFRMHPGGIDSIKSRIAEILYEARI